MQRSSGSRLFPIFIVLVIIIIIIVAIISIGRAIFSGAQKDDTASEQQDAGRTALLDTSPTHSVRLTVRGPIVAQEEFASYQINISPSQRAMDVYKGYLDDVQRSKTLTNNKNAYEQFVYALDKANMMKGDEPTDDDKNDLRGICATGYVYEYSVRADDQTVKRLWTSTCDGSKGTLQASTKQLNDLFLAQIPKADDLVPFRTSPLTQLKL